MMQQMLNLVLEANNLVSVILFGLIVSMSGSAFMNLYNRKIKVYHDEIKDDELLATAVVQIGMVLILSYVAILRYFPEFAASGASKVGPLQAITVGLGSITLLIGIILTKKVSNLRERAAYAEKLAEEQKVLEAQKQTADYFQKITG